MDNILPLVVSPAQAAVLLNISRSKFYELAGDRIPLLKLGRRSLVKVADIQKFLESLEAGGER